ncbi:class I SAM-dependent methyltransferase [Paenibacillus daejeonensis]|uniref:class I SAM-dependent methyltransferase n=1 Tax=Paenibacillus daejeonensis TaxID=135193 RepID=UPI000368B7C7|nr:class I SAM-dependent methyltransferase [Paenibacillus daejeonensis]
MGFPSVLGMAKTWVSQRLSPGDAAIDATAGTGVDTLFLAESVGARGSVYAFDIQPLALARTAARLDARFAGEAAVDKPEIALIAQSHAEMRECIPERRHGRVSAIMFNLGYLPDPDADQRIITNPSSTLTALEAGLALLRPGGIMTAVVYPGHPGGAEEADAVAAWAAAQPAARCQCVYYRMTQKPSAPYLIALETRRQPSMP